MSEIRISEIIKELRGNAGISQETLADVCDVSMQAVSKWENGQSCPDITLLPLLAKYFNVSIDYLLTGQKNPSEQSNITINQIQRGTAKDILYIIQYQNGKILSKEQWIAERLKDPKDAIQIRFDPAFEQMKTNLHIAVWGDANIIAPDTTMNLDTDGNVNCGDVKGNIKAGANVHCNTVKGNVSAGNSVNCSTIMGDAKAGCSISCETIQGSANAGNKIEYKNI